MYNFNIVRIKSLLNRAERPLNRVETLTKIIPVLSKDNLEVIKDCEELKTAISDRDYPIICDIWEALRHAVVWPLLFFEYKVETLPDGSIFFPLYRTLAEIFSFLLSKIMPIGIAFGCW